MGNEIMEKRGEKTAYKKPELTQVSLSTSRRHLGLQFGDTHCSRHIHDSDSGGSPGVPGVCAT